MAITEVNDSSWTRRAMFAPRRPLGAVQSAAQRFTGSRYKFVDTSPGGALVMNPMPQANALADPRVRQVTNTMGIGTVYSEVFDDNNIIVSFQLGVPKFNSLSRFVGNFYNPHLATFVNRGEAAGISYDLGYAAGFLLTLPLQIIFGLDALITKISQFVTNTSYTKFYYMKPAMPQYWNAVQSLFNKICVNMGIIQASIDENGANAVLTSDEAEILTRTMPDILRSSTYGDSTVISSIDVKAIATRAQRLADQQYAALDKLARDAGSVSEYEEGVRTIMNNNFVLNDTTSITYSSYFNAYVAAQAKITEQVAVGEEATEENSAGLPRDPDFITSLLAELHDGSMFVNFRVDGIDSISDSFSTSVKTASIVDTLNGANTAAREATFAIAQGNILGDTQKMLLDTVTNFLKGGLDATGLANLTAFAGNAYVDIPKIPDESSADIGKISLKIPLRAPSGTPLAIALHTYLPFCMLLAMVLPRSTGLHSYTTPFLCRAQSKGMLENRLCMVTNLSAERAASNIKWTDGWLVPAIDVTLELTPMDEIMHMPIMQSFTDLRGSILNAFQEDNAMTDYLGMLGGRSLHDDLYLGPRAKMKWAQFKADWDSTISRDNMAQWSASTAPGRLIGSIMRTSVLTK